MELIATARFKKAMDRATAATAYTRHITRLVADLAQAGAEVKHPLLQQPETTRRGILLVLTANRGLCGGYNSSVIRMAVRRREELLAEVEDLQIEMAGKRGIAAMKFRKIPLAERFTHFEDRPKFEEVEVIANRYLDLFLSGQVDRVDVAYTRFVSSSKQEPVVETVLPMGSLEGSDESAQDAAAGQPAGSGLSMYEFLPSAESILEEVVPASFRVKMFKCFLDAAVSEQISRMVAMKSATENADDIIKQLSMTYNRARQSQITNEIMEIIGGAEALSN